MIKLSNDMTSFSKPPRELERIKNMSMQTHKTFIWFTVGIQFTVLTALKVDCNDCDTNGFSELMMFKFLNIIKPSLFWNIDHHYTTININPGLQTIIHSNSSIISPDLKILSNKIQIEKVKKGLLRLSMVQLFLLAFS